MALSTHTNTFAGIVRPISLAVFGLMINSNFYRLLNRKISGLGDR